MHTFDDRLLTIAEVAQRLSCSKVSVYRYVERGELPATRLGDGLSPLRVSEHDLSAWLEANRTSPPEAA